MAETLLVQHKGKSYQLEKPDIERIIEELRSRTQLRGARERMAVLGLMSLETVASQCSAVGDGNRLENFYTEWEIMILDPALQAIAEYYSQKNNVYKV